MSLPIPFNRDFVSDGLPKNNWRLERDAARAERTSGRRLRGRLVSDGERTYRAYSADELIAIDGEAHHGRPGLPY
jgi:hypothetical protein